MDDESKLIDESSSGRPRRSMSPTPNIPRAREGGGEMPDKFLLRSNSSDGPSNASGATIREKARVLSRPDTETEAKLSEERLDSLKFLTRQREALTAGLEAEEGPSAIATPIPALEDVYTLHQLAKQAASGGGLEGHQEADLLLALAGAVVIKEGETPPASEPMGCDEMKAVMAAKSVEGGRYNRNPSSSGEGASVRVGSLSGSSQVAKAALQMLGLADGQGGLPHVEQGTATFGRKGVKKSWGGGRSPGGLSTLSKGLGGRAADGVVPAVKAGGFEIEVPVKILPTPPTYTTSFDVSHAQPLPVTGGEGETSFAQPSLWNRAVTATSACAKSAHSYVAEKYVAMPAQPSLESPPTPTPVKQLLGGPPPNGKLTQSPGGKLTNTNKLGFEVDDWCWGHLAKCVCDVRVLVLLVLLGGLFALTVLLMGASTHINKVNLLPVNASMLFSPPPPPSPALTDIHALMGAGSKTECTGPCCSSLTPLPPPGVPTMPSLWWSNQITDGAQIQIRSMSNNQWWSPGPSGSWADFGAFNLAAAPSQFLKVRRISATQIQLETSEGHYVAAHKDGTVAADQRAEAPSTIFTILLVSNSTSQVKLRAYDNMLLTTLHDGSLVRTLNPMVAETFEIRELLTLPSIRGVNFGNWLVTEEWMSPPLFLRVPLFTDGLEFQLQSSYSGNWVSTTVSPGGQVTAEVAANSTVSEAFYLRSAGGGKYYIRASDYMYWSAVGGGGGAVLANAASPGAEGYELFTLALNPADRFEFMIQTFDGHYLRVNDNGSISATVSPDKVDVHQMGGSQWISRKVFAYNEVGTVRGEYQLSGEVVSANVGRADVETMMTGHRESWITESDFEWLADHHVNSVRVPVGYWITEPAPDHPFVSGGAAFLDQAFNWGEKYGVRIMLSMHGAPGSQNGMEHSGSRDGVPDWATDIRNVDRTLEAIKWLVARYAASHAFLGIGLLNEPLAEAVPLNILKQYYLDAYHIVREHSECAYVAIQPRVGGEATELNTFMKDDTYTNTIVEQHMVQLFEDHFQHMSPADLVAFVEVNRTAEIARVEEDGRLSMVGEWSLATPAKLGASNNELTRLGEAQLATYGKATAGWFFWTYKLGRSNAPGWSFEDSYANGWLTQKLGGGW